jgi:hypothetical protein
MNTTVKGKGAHIVAQGIKTKQGRKVLLINKHNTEVYIQLPAEASNSSIKEVDIITRENPPVQTALSGSIHTLKPFSVAVVEVK